MENRSPVRLIAVDMDGTLLDDQKRYDKSRFAAQLAQLNRLGIRFVVASGNQFYKLQEYFAEHQTGISYVAENGGYVHDGEQELFAVQFDQELVEKVYALIGKVDRMSAVICGHNCAYYLEGANPDDVENAKNHYARFEAVKSYHNIEDTVLKIALKMEPEDHAQVLAQVNELFGAELDCVTSGHQWIDLILPGVHKGYGLSLLQKQWGIEDHQVMAFGDSNNDLEMLQRAGFSFAMANANERIKSVAKYQTRSNNEDGVLNAIDRLIAYSISETEELCYE